MLTLKDTYSRQHIIPIVNSTQPHISGFCLIIKLVSLYSSVSSKVNDDII